MSKKLAAKNAMIEMPVSTRPLPEQHSDAPAPTPRTRTAVGGMAQFVTTQSPIHREAEALRKVVEGFEGARVVRALAPSSIAASEWANRHDDSFQTADFAELKREIREAGGNVQPIKVRPLNGSTPGSGAPQYEIVFGHRRHRACLELNIPVNALIEPVDDQKLFEQMERENRGRKNLSAWEQGSMYQAALDKGLYPSQRKLSEAIGVDVSLISKSISLAKLPAAVIEAFPSPLEIQYRWAQPLSEALQKDPDAMVARAGEIRQERKTRPLNAIETFARLTAVSLSKMQAGRTTTLHKAGKKVGEFHAAANSAVTISIGAGILSAERRTELLEMVDTFLKRAD